MHKQILFKLSGTLVADTNFPHENSCSLVMHCAYIHARRVKTCGFFFCVCVCVCVCARSHTGVAPVWSLTVLYSALLDSSIKTTHTTTSSLSPLIVMQPSAPYTSATVGLQTDEVRSSDGKTSHVLKTTRKASVCRVSAMGKDIIIL